MTAVARLLGYACAAHAVACSGAFAQTTTPGPGNNTATVTATANVVGSVELIVIKNMDFEVSHLSPVDFSIDPQRDSLAGHMKIIGASNSFVKVTYEVETVLRHEESASKLRFAYNISGGESKIQKESVLLVQDNQVQLSDKGEYYLWVGGSLSGIKDIMPGSYETELTIELEYIL
jgi:hypothetical protein